MKIRKGILQDVGVCTKINRMVWNKKWKDPAYLKERVKKGEMLVAIEGNEIIGYVAFRKNYWNRNWFLGELAVHPEHQRRGVASAIMKEVENMCFKEGARLFSSTESTNMSSIKFHEKNGFSMSGYVDNMFIENTKELIFSKKGK